MLKLPVSIWKRNPNMTRHELRESIFLLLFRIEFHDADQLPEQLQIFMDSISHERERAFYP